VDASGRLILPDGSATEATLASLVAAAATEPTLAALLTAVAKETTLSTRASEATLDALKTGVSKDSSVQSVLAALNAIKDTDGIKKILDALPAGDNVLGRVKVEDADGHGLSVEADGALSALKTIQDIVSVQGEVETTPKTYHVPFSNSQAVEVVHGLDAYPENIRVLTEDGLPSGWGIGGFGVGGFGNGAFAGAVKEEDQFQLGYNDSNTFTVVLQTKTSGVVVYRV
jgi:hypothetical protein